MPRATAVVVALLWIAAPLDGARAQTDPYPLDDLLRVNDIWSVGTHNSYHLRFLPEPLLEEWDYEHAPLEVQLDEQGVRKFELDVFWAPEGFRVHHFNVFDNRTSCLTLIICLGIIRDWSLAHPGHHPLFVFIEPKGIHSETQLSDEPITGHYDQLDEEVRAVLEPGGLITPDEVRGSWPTLREAILNDGWPSLRETRGRILVVMLDGGVDREQYGEGRSALQGRAMFVTSSEGRDDAAVIAVDGPVGGFDRIQSLVSLGYVIRTRADNLTDAWAGDTTRRDAALASGAQVISTDFPAPGMLDNGYFVEIPGGTPSGCNPITTAGLGCEPRDIENPEVLRGPDNCPGVPNPDQADTDGDGHGDACDNCTLVANPAQRDSNADGYGNRCDADLDDDGRVDFADLGLFKSVFFSDDPHADLNGDGGVNFLDLGLFKTLFMKPPGPSGTAP